MSTCRVTVNRVRAWRAWHILSTQLLVVVIIASELAEAGVPVLQATGDFWWGKSRRPNGDTLASPNLDLTSLREGAGRDPCGRTKEARGPASAPAPRLLAAPPHTAQAPPPRLTPPPAEAATGALPGRAALSPRRLQPSSARRARAHSGRRPRPRPGLVPPAALCWRRLSRCGWMRRGSPGPWLGGSRRRGGGPPGPGTPREAAPGRGAE